MIFEIIKEQPQGESDSSSIYSDETPEPENKYQQSDSLTAGIISTVVGDQSPLKRITIGDTIGHRIKSVTMVGDEPTPRKKAKVNFLPETHIRPNSSHSILLVND